MNKWGGVKGRERTYVCVFYVPETKKGYSTSSSTISFSLGFIKHYFLESVISLTK